MEKEQSIVKKILGGNQRAFKDLIEDYQNLVAHIVFRLVSLPQDREDICQEVFIKVYQNLSGFKFQSKLSTWIGRIAYNTTVNYLRREKTALYEDLRPANADQSDFKDNKNTIDSIKTDYPTPLEIMESRNRSIYIQKQIDKLPAPYRTILTLYHLDQMSYHEISEIMDIPEGTLKSYLFRGRKKLKDSLVRELEGEVI